VSERNRLRADAHAVDSQRRRAVAIRPQAGGAIGRDEKNGQGLEGRKLRERHRARASAADSGFANRQREALLP
jgi:hypothetical protein